MPPVTVSVQRLSTRLQAGKLALDARPVSLARNPHIDLRPGLGGNHIGLRPAAQPRRRSPSGRA